MATAHVHVFPLVWPREKTPAPVTEMYVASVSCCLRDPLGGVALGTCRKEIQNHLANYELTVAFIQVVCAIR